MSDRPKDEHAAITAQRYLADIATMFPDLIYGLGRNGNGQSERVSGSKERPLPIRENVSEALTAVHEFAMHLADRVYWETKDHENLAELLDDDILATVSRRYIGVFAANDDTEGRAFAKECRRLAGHVHSVAYPHGSRWVDVPNRAGEEAKRRDLMPCVEVIEGEEPQRCPGHYRMRLDPNGRWFTSVANPETWPPLTCSKESAHIVTGVELARALAWARMNETTCGEELAKWRAA